MIAAKFALHHADLVVTRHQGLVDYLRQDLGLPKDAPVADHVDAGDVAGKIIVGVLPLRLAARAALVVEVPLALTFEDRGRDLPVERVREIAGDPVVYQVQEIGADVLCRKLLDKLRWQVIEGAQFQSGPVACGIVRRVAVKNTGDPDDSSFGAGGHDVLVAVCDEVKRPSAQPQFWDALKTGRTVEIELDRSAVVGWAGE